MPNWRKKKKFRKKQKLRMARKSHILLKKKWDQPMVNTLGQRP